MLLLLVPYRAEGQASPSAPARPAPEVMTPERQSQELRRQADAAYRAGRFEEALVALERARALAPYPLHAFNVAAVQHQLGRCEQARDLFEEYLRTDPGGPAVAEARLALDELYARCGRAAPVASAKPSAPAPPASPRSALPAVMLPSASLPAPRAQAVSWPVTSASSRALDTSPSARDVAAWSLLALGGGAAVAAVTSAILVRRAESDLDALSSRSDRVWNPDEARSLRANGRRYEALSLACGFGSAVLLGTGIGLTLLGESSEAEAGPLQAGAMLLYTRRL